MIGFDPNAKWFKNPFENVFGKSNWKMKRKFYSFSFTSFLFGMLAHFLPQARPPSSPFPPSFPTGSAHDEMETA
jgi:hypothetical protein